jgi:hypothetical protein
MPAVKSFFFLISQLGVIVYITFNQTSFGVCGLSHPTIRISKSNLGNRIPQNIFPFVLEFMRWTKWLHKFIMIISHSQERRTHREESAMFVHSYATGTSGIKDNLYAIFALKWRIFQAHHRHIWSASHI